ncbi:MAG TPA: CPBP family intramembrane glutamic endopeptidase [Candidatus Paceibacterota bacterium]
MFELKNLVSIGSRYTSRIEPWYTIVLVPLWQEFLFRFLPFQFWYLHTGEFLLAGLVGSALFATIHWYFGWRFVLYAGIGGMFLWWVMVTYGFFAVVFLHALVNAIDLAFGLRKFLIENPKR